MKHSENHAISHESEPYKGVLKTIALAVLSIIMLYLATVRVFSLSAPFSEYDSTVMSIVRLLLFVAAVFLGKDVFARGFASVTSLKPNAESLAVISMALASLASFYSLIMVAIGRTEYADRMHFETCTVIVTFMSAASCVQRILSDKRLSPDEKLATLLPKTVTVLKGSLELSTPLEDVKVGDMLFVKAGDSFCCDGAVMSGRCCTDESLFTGDQMPVDKGSGDRVYAGTVCTSGFVTVLVESMGKDTELGATISDVKRMIREKESPREVFGKVRKMERLYVLCAVGLSLLAMLIWLIASGNVTDSLEVMVRILLLSCPCAVCFVSALTAETVKERGEREGIIFKSPYPYHIEKISRVDTAVMDKTGVITVGRPFVTDVTPLGVRAEEIVRIAASLERKSAHPIASAITDYAKSNDIEPFKCDSCEPTENFGLRGELGEDTFLIADAKSVFVGENEGYSHVSQPLIEQGKIVVAVVKNGSPIGVIAFGDKIKPTSRAGVELLKSFGIDTVMVTGSGGNSAKLVADEAGISDFYENVTPHEKAELVSRLQGVGRTVAMLGDSANDIIALSKADVGVAVGIASEPTLEAARTVLVRNDLRDLSKAIKISRFSVRTATQSFVIGMVLNAVDIPIMAIAPLIIKNPMVDAFICAVCLTISSVAAAVNCRRIMKVDLTVE